MYELLKGPASGIDAAALAQLPRVCHRCLGRLFAKVGVGFPNVERGMAAATILTYSPVDEKDCPLCRGVFLKLDRYLAQCVRAIEPWEARTILVGSRFDPESTELEERFWNDLKTQSHEPIKSEFNRELGKALSAATSKEPDFERPDVTVVVDTQYDTVDVQVAPLFIKGRYKKLVRGIPQTRWPCRACRGKGCDRCGGTGKMYQTSVEEIVAKPVMELTGGSEHFLHGMGREDVDALMLGDGRPFVLEIRGAMRRSVDLAEVESRVNSSGAGVTIADLSPSSSAEVVEMKEARGAKGYTVTVAFQEDVPEAKLNEVVALLRGREIVQRTPSRVAHRRSDKHRRRVVEDAAVLSWTPRQAVLSIRAETGTYIKELVHGDEGRTRPSLAELLGVPCAVETLEVTDVGGERR